jgi:hypothetical protein
MDEVHSEPKVIDVCQEVADLRGEGQVRLGLACSKLPKLRKVIQPGLLWNE